jgi:hypothetical protein
VVSTNGCSNDNGVDRIRQQVSEVLRQDHVPIPSTQLAQSLDREIGNPYQLCVAHLTHVSNEMWPPVAGANYANSKLLHACTFSLSITSGG